MPLEKELEPRIGQFLSLRGTILSVMEKREKENAANVYELARLSKEERRSGDDDERRAALIVDLREAKIVVGDDGRGGGWRLLDQDGINLMPDREFLFADKGHCWVYWMGYGRPYGARMYAISNPLEEEAALKIDGPFVVDGDGNEDVDRPRFTVIEGGLESEQEPPSDGPSRPSEEWELEEKIEEDLEEDLAEDAYCRLRAAAELVCERWGGLALDVMCSTIEEVTGLALLAYDDETDRVVFGGDLIEELRGRKGSGE